jgi:WASH complex subunit strumpellin
MDQENTNSTRNKSMKNSCKSLFLAPENLCGQTLLSIVGRGHSILADIRILSECVPSAFLAAAQSDEDEPQNTAHTGLLGFFRNNAPKPTQVQELSEDTDDVEKYTPFLFDFSYLHHPHEQEASLSVLSSDSNSERKHLESLDELEREFAVNHQSIIEKFYKLFSFIYDYQVELNQFENDLSKGYFIQYTVESVLLDQDGRVLLCEAVWLYGVMLIMMERFLPVSNSAILRKPIMRLHLTQFPFLSFHIK